MGTSFDRWEKDPFFAAAEEVQESADRMESVHRLWLQERRAADAPASVALRRDLHTVLGTAKWQLEELERAVTSTDKAWSAGEDTMARHSHFVAAIADKISTVENSLRESNLRDGEPALSWVRLDEGERDELAQFLSSTSMDKESGEASGSCSKNSFPSTESSSASVRTAVDAGELKVPALSEGSPLRLPGEQPNLPPPRIIRFSGLASAIESATKLRWYRNGFTKWKGGSQHDATESIPLRNHQLSQDIDACYERGKNCLSSCDEFDEKQINGWAAALHRQLQRSQYQIQYGRPIQLIVWVVLAVLFIAILVLFSS